MSRINIVQIQTALLIPITAQFIENKLGIAPSEKEKRAVYWKDTDYAAICDRLVTYVKQRRDVNITAISGERPKSGDAPAPAAASGDGGFDFGDEPQAEDGNSFDFGDEPQAESTTEEFF
jgi:hypothetical protein